MGKVLLATFLIFSFAFSSESAWGDRPNRLDPVYQLKVDDYPKFEADITLENGREIRFCCVKSMMHFYFSPYRYPEYGTDSSDAVKKMLVKDYLDGSKIDAKKAWYVFGSRLVGPHGDDLIPLSSKSRAELFVKRYGGTRIMPFEKLSASLVRYLDM